MMCAKIPYRSKGEAKRATRRSASLYGGRLPEAFLCDHCGLWHVGHAPKGSVVRCRDCDARIRLGREKGGPRFVPYDPLTGELHVHA